MGQSIIRPGLDVHQSKMRLTCQPKRLEKLVIRKLELEFYPEETCTTYSSMAGG